jgi:hypothetical protein
MKRKIARKATRPAEPAMEYDFSKGVTGKYALRYWESEARADVATTSPRRCASNVCE